MKQLSFLIIVLLMMTPALFGQHKKGLETLTAEFKKAVPAGFQLDESGVDNNNLFLVFKKGPQDIITVNLQQEYKIEFQDTENFEHKQHKMVFYYAGFEKNGGLVVFLKDKSGYLVVGYNKPYMGEEIVRKEELLSIIDKINLTTLNQLSQK